jgi:hypothetical protein
MRFWRFSAMRPSRGGFARGARTGFHSEPFRSNGWSQRDAMKVAQYEVLGNEVKGKSVP